ncbi:MAG: NADH-quinone oxidoreductase subunit C [Eggerthellaceae bacterium]|nr:NADH-quinone oxidoreductase subunit C [Eggerthellaceae bacterium]
MEFKTEFVTIPLSAVKDLALKRKVDGWRYVQTLAVTTDEGFDLIYSFQKNGLLVNSKVEGVTKEDIVPSITGQYLEAFVFENEIHDLFGIHFEGIAIDFKGRFYDVAIQEPMSIISPEQKAAREKAAKAAAAKEAREKAKKSEAASAPEILTDEEIEAKVAGLDPDKAEKLRKALKAKNAKAKAAADTAKKESEAASSAAQILTDEEIEANVAGMDPDKAEKVRAALKAKSQKARKGD